MIGERSRGRESRSPRRARGGSKLREGSLRCERRSSGLALSAERESWRISHGQWLRRSIPLERLAGRRIGTSPRPLVHTGWRRRGSSTSSRRSQTRLARTHHPSSGRRGEGVGDWSERRRGRGEDGRLDIKVVGSVFHRIRVGVWQCQILQLLPWLRDRIIES